MKVDMAGGDLSTWCQLMARTDTTLKREKMMKEDMATNMPSLTAYSVSE